MYSQVQSPICDVLWSGWRSDTLTLSRSGWRLAEAFDNMMCQHKFYLENESLRLVATAEMEMLKDLHAHHRPLIQVTQVAGKIFERYQVQTTASFAPTMQYSEIETMPVYREQPIFDPAQLFARKEQTVPEIFYEKADMSVVEHLQAIKALQSDKQAELRKRVLDVTSRTSQEPMLKLVAVN